MLSLVFILFYRDNIKFVKFGFSDIFKETTIIILLGSAWWFLIYFTQYFSFTHTLSPLVGDDIFFSKVSESLNNFGKESNFGPNLHFLHKDFAPNLYHYFDLWFNAFIIKCFDLLTILSGYLIVNIVFLVIASMGIVGVMELFTSTKISPIDYFWSILLLSFKGVLLTYVLTDIDTFYQNIFDIPKVAITYILIIAYLILQRLKLLNSAWFVLLIMALAFTPISPTIIASLSILLLIRFIKTKFSLNIFTSFKFISLMIVILFLGLFYGLINKGTSEIQTAIFFSKEFSMVKYLKTFINIIGKTTLQIGILYLPFFVLLLPYIFKNFRNIKLPTIDFFTSNLALILSCFISLILWGIFSTVIFASVEFFVYISIPVINIFFIVLIVQVIRERKYKKYSLIPLSIIGIFCVYFFFMNTKDLRANDMNVEYSKAYLTEVNSMVKDKIQNSYGGSVMSPKDYSPDKVHGQLSLVYTMGNYLKYMKNDFNTVSISPDSSSYFKAIILLVSPFNVFIKDQIKNNTFKNTAQSQIDFINKYNIQYIVTSKSVELDSVFNGIIERQITDSISHEHFILLKTINK